MTPKSELYKARFLGELDRGDTGAGNVVMAAFIALASDDERTMLAIFRSLRKYPHLQRGVESIALSMVEELGKAGE